MGTRRRRKPANQGTPELDDMEMLAADLVVHLTSAKCWEHLDDGSRPKTRDFDIVFEDGHRESLEVTTSSRDRPAIQQDRETRRSKHDWSLPSCEYDWSVSIRPTGVSINTLSCQVEPLLARLEELGVTSAWPPPAPGSPSERVFTALDNLGVEHVHRGPASSHSRASVQPSLGGAFGPDEVTDAVQPEIDECGNREKVAAGRHPRGHLFVWVDWVGGASYAAFGSIIDPTTAPVTNREINIVWASPALVDFDGETLRSQVWESDGTRWIRHGYRPVLGTDGVLEDD